MAVCKSKGKLAMPLSKYLILLIMFLHPSHLSSQPREFGDYGPRIDATYHFDLSNFFPPDRLTLDEIRTRANDNDSYEGFLKFLAQRRPQLFENYILIHDTGSIQYADRQRPRVVLFGDGLLLSFAEDPRTADRTVEILAFDERHQQFQAHELRFQEQTTQLVESPSNCQSCHGSTLKPLWDPYDFWPNVYGSSIARFGSDQEKAAYEQLRTQTRPIGIYRYLKWYLPPPNNNQGLPGIETFTEYVTQLQLLASIQSWRQKSSRIDPFIPALLAVLNECTRGSDDQASAALLETYLPESWHGRIVSELPTLHDGSKAERSKFKSYQVARYQRLFPGARTLFPMDHQRLADETMIGAQLKIILREMGLDVRDIAMSQVANPYLLSVPGNGGADFATDLKVLAPDLFEVLRPKIRPVDATGYTWARFDCDALQAKSRESLSQLQPLDRSLAKTNAPTVFGECIACHVLNVASSQAPNIPFDQTGALRSYLSNDHETGLNRLLDRINRTGVGQMPPGRVLTETEKVAFLENIQTLLRKP